MKMLITGGAGFVGSHLCDKYVREGHKVICLDNFMNGDLRNVRHLLVFRNFKLMKGDIRDFDLLQRIMRDVDVVFHLAAQIHVERSYIEPQLTYDINVMGTQNILEIARLHDIKRVIYASTSEVYGSSLYHPMDEKHPLNAPHPYGASKIAADRMCYAYIQAFGMDIAIMRLFNIFGPRQKDIGYGGVISIFTRRVLSGLPPILYGDGSQTRDYTFVDDAVRAYDLVMNYSEPINEPVNFGSGKELSILDIANRIIGFCDKSDDIQPIHVEPRIGEVKRLIADSTRAKNLLGWEPQYDMDKGMREFVQWYRNYGFEEKINIG
ncbi:MAG: NAD-dependent epimerase/dehydratase family protein [Chloroflexi bacterium]|jgi:UDP-glucose 4-epimerase|nr:NAD-dependent epimerase/dehydratase family protein [Chloroflexota bacterium]